MASTALSPELVCGHMLVQVDILEKAVNELDARQVKAAAEQDAKHVRAEATQSAAMQLVQSLLTQMTELRKELQEVRAHNQALAARLNAELELPRSASGASRPATLEELIQRRDALAEIKAAHVDCGMAKSAGYTCAEARVVGYTLSEAKVAWATDELRAAGYISSKGMTSRDFMDQYAAGRSNFSGLDFTGEDFEGMVLDKACTFLRCIFVGASFRHATLVGVNFSHADLSDCDLSHASLRDCTLTGAQLANSNLTSANFQDCTMTGAQLANGNLTSANFQKCTMTGAQLANGNLTSANFQDCTLTDAKLPAKGRWGGVKRAKLSGNFGTAPIKQLGFSCAEVKAMGMVQGLKAAGYTCAEAKQAGYTCAEARQGGYTCAEAKQGGYTFAEMKQGGYVEGLKAAGYTLAEVKQVGYTLAEMKQGGYTCAEMKQAGFNPRECMQAGFTSQEGVAAGYPFQHYHWYNGKPPPGIEPRLTLAACALRLRAPPFTRRGGPPPPPCRARARAARAPACGPPAWRARAANSRPLVRVASSRGGAGRYDWNGIELR